MIFDFLKTNFGLFLIAFKSFLEKEQHFGICEAKGLNKHYCMSEQSERVVMRGQMTKWSSQKRFAAAIFFGYFLLGKQKKVTILWASKESNNTFGQAKESNNTFVAQKKVNKRKNNLTLIAARRTPVAARRTPHAARRSPVAARLKP